MSHGWIKLHRAITEWEWYQDQNTFRLFIHLIVTANHKPKRWQGIEVLPGQTVTSREKLSSELRLTPQKIRTSLNKLKSTSEITIKTTNKFTVITINKWHEYQGAEQKMEAVNFENQPSKQPASQPSNNHQITTNKNDKNEKKLRIRNTPQTPQGGAGMPLCVSDINHNDQLSNSTHDTPPDATELHTSEEKTLTAPTPKGKAKKKRTAAPKPDGVDQQHWDDWLAARKSKRLCVPTITVMQKIQREADKAGLSLPEVIRICAEKPWGGFEANWLNNTNIVKFGGDSDGPHQQAPKQAPKPSWKESSAEFDERMRREVERISRDGIQDFLGVENFDAF